MARYINPYTDFGFKKLFGTELNKELLISFLNSLLPDGQTVKDITYLNTEKLGTQEIDRRAVFDVYCENEQGEKFLVEMQKGEQQFFKDRSLFYSTFPIREQAEKGKNWNYELKAVYTIGILNFTFDNSSDDYFHHEVKLVDMGSQEVFYDKLTLIYLEMPKFNKAEEELENMFDKWMFVLRNLSGLMERPAALQERVFNRLFEAAEIAQFDRRELVEYEDSLKNFRDWYSVMETTLNKGLAQGRVEGRVEGIIEVARNMKSKSIPLQTIQELTGLSLEEIELL
ncbi:Rpn family recombination-promoting nuclease/putative transposase [Bacteroides sp. 224]|uniref:Rpn family recombination-promoting nuclease/putative transposase n=1 Tax=Bacteroides sp. 224 TaxID=2302936 RepID=UPI0013D4EB73|nr:Rpn family recombination-promoting nuclease/putative transposase [Bacteroides sp. 224]NDV64486.1 Rpn family recombination-promoting nuclease/putative transposase [Bacteroides sp. 224]